jgi:signal transduction histidine kinase
MHEKRQPCDDTYRETTVDGIRLSKSELARRRPTILVVDDDAVQRVMVRESLEQVGYAVVEAGNGAEGLDEIRRCQPDLVLLDVVMPELDGFDTCAELRRHQETEHLPVIMVTGLEDVHSVQRAFDVGATSFLTKPMNWALLDYHIKYILRAKRTEQELREAKEKAETASRVKTDFLATMSHELRTPLNAIIGFSEVVKEELLGPLGNRKYTEYMHDIHRSGVHLLELINDVLEFAKFESGKLDLVEGEINLNQVIDTAVRQVKPLAEVAGVKLHQRIAEELPLYRADQRKLSQILLNLLSNAIKFTPVGGEVRVISKRDKSGRISMTINDTGIGIAPQDIDAIFEPFHQLDSTLTRKYQGTGLGVPLAAAMIELHGGTLSFDSEVGVGTKATVELPADRIIRPEEIPLESEPTVELET